MKIQIEDNLTLVKVTNMKPGQLGIIVNDASYGGTVVLRTSIALVDIKNGSFWSNVPGIGAAPFDVQLLPKGSRVILTVE